ncbi:putative hypothetical protein [Streptomyces sp. NBRC 110611]|nr:putative hypothetical protein [Streptomyces sp. NBRC 110611]
MRIAARGVAGDGLVDLVAQTVASAEVRSGAAEVGDGGIRVEGVLRKGAEEDGHAEGRRVVGDAAVVAEDAVCRDERLAPALQRRDQRQAGAAGSFQPGPDLAGAVPVPDVGVQYRHRAVLVGG